MWLQTFRESMGMSLDELGAAIRRLGAKERPPVGCSDELLYRLERDPNFKTVPVIANLIATACGATAEQRDALVLKHYRGQWTPTGEAKIKIRREEPEPQNPHLVYKPVVAIDREGNAAMRYTSITNAANSFGIGRESVSIRCRHKMEGNEFTMVNFTFRFADEWDAMSPDRRRLEAFRARTKPPKPPKAEADLPEEQRPMYATCKPVVMVDLWGREFRYSSIVAAHYATGVGIKSIRKLLYKSAKEWPYNHTTYAIRYAKDWDAMSEDARRAFLRN